MATEALSALNARAIARQQKRLIKSDAKIEWFGEKVKSSIKIGMNTRLKIAAQLLRDRTVINVGRPVRKIRSRGITRVDPASRSTRGEFPRADTTRLMKDIFWELPGGQEATGAIVGTTLDYGLLLETTMKRSFLRRTLNEVAPKLAGILTTGRQSDFPGNNE